MTVADPPKQGSRERSGSAGWGSAAAAWVPMAVSVAGMIATPLVGRGGPARRLLSSVVITGLSTTTAVVSARRWGTARTVLAGGSVAAGCAAVEHVGVETGLPFGRYCYTGALRPQVRGVPAIVPLAWVAMAVPARETAHAALGRRSNRVNRIIAGAATMTAWDLFLDPQMVGEGYWRWARPGRYRGIPLSNFAGWFATSLGVMAVLEFVLPPREPSPALVGEYAYMAVMETVGFAAYFRDPVVAVVGGSAMLPVAAVAAARLLNRRFRG